MTAIQWSFSFSEIGKETAKDNEQGVSGSDFWHSAVERIGFDSADFHVFFWYAEFPIFSVEINQ
jgi:hypothetical protein